MIDLSFLTQGTGTGAVQLPDMAAIEAKRLGLENARRDGEMDNLRIDAVRRKNASDDAYNKAIAPIIQSGFDQDVIAKTLQQYPEAAPMVQKAWDDHLARADKRANTDADVFSKKTEKLLVQYSQMAGGLADAIKSSPDKVPDAMIANFYEKMADNGLGKFMPKLPFKDWSDKAAVAGHLKQLGDAFYTTSQRKTDVETNRNNIVTAEGNAATRAETNRAHLASEATARGNLGVAQGNLAVNQGELQFKKDKQKTEDGRPSKQVIDVELKVADDYKAQSKAFQETARSINLINTALNTADKNPGSALAAGTAFMKLLDPGSVVRESELGMALNASGWIDRARNKMQELQHGKIMTAEQVVNLRAAARELFEEAKATQRQIDQQYGDKVSRYGGNPKNVVLDLGQNVVGERPGPGAAKGATFAPAPSGSGADWVYVPGPK